MKIDNWLSFNFSKFINKTWLAALSWMASGDL